MVFFIFAGRLEAGVVINEIQISPTENRFIELYNNTSRDIDLTGYYLQRKTLTGDKFSSFVTGPNFEGKKIRANSYFLISKGVLSNSDIVLDNLTITESNSIQVKNSKQEVVYKIGMGDSADCGNACIPNPTAGKSTQRVSEDSWILGVPSPGVKNTSNEETPENNQQDEEQETGDPVVVSEKTKEIFNPTIKTKIIAPKVAVAGIPFLLDQETIGHKGEKIRFDRFVWNFGDGNAKEMKPCLPFNYVYAYPGDYALGLSYYETSFSVVPEATNKVNIKVIPSGIEIVSVGSFSDPFVELENNSNYEMILNNWSIVGSKNVFIIPNGTTILPNKKIKFSPKTTGFNYEDLSSLTILDDSKTIFAVYPKSKIVSSNKLIYNTSLSAEKNISNTAKNTKKEEDSKKEVIDLNNLEASVYNSTNKAQSGIIYSGLFFVIAIGIIAVIAIKNNDKKDGIEDVLSADDIKIIE